MSNLGASGQSFRQRATKRKVLAARITYSIPMLIPHSRLSPATLRAVVEEFVTRDGTDHTLVEQRIKAVLSQLDAGLVSLHFDDVSESCNFLPASGDQSVASATNNAIT
jgi:uncharacterized protein YheU (UPF0270 family)